MKFDEEIMRCRREEIMRSKVGAVVVFIDGRTASRKEADR
jgi:hypothetical protein